MHFGDCIFSELPCTTIHKDNLYVEKHFFLQEKELEPFAQPSQEKYSIHPELQTKAAHHQRSGATWSSFEYNQLESSQVHTPHLNERGLLLNRVTPRVYQVDAEPGRYMQNQSAVKEFILLGFQGHPALLFPAFLATYLAILLGNGLILVVTTCDSALRTPMYFFLRSLSGLEMCYTSVLLPKMMANLVSGDLTISLQACATQMFFILFLGGTECFLLAAMAYDRYLAICLPLRYMMIMNHRVRAGLVAGSFAISFPIQLVQIGLIFSLPFCGPNVIDDFFCDIPPVLNLACTDLFLNELAVYLENILFVILPFVLILISYVYITRAILRMPSKTGRQKAFSTCSSHITAVSLLYGSGMLVYLQPKTPDKVVSLLYTIIIPLCNPFIYTLRNREVKAALSRLFGRKPIFEVASELNQWHRRTSPSTPLQLTAQSCASLLRRKSH
ncbi:olfactory receptor 10AG1-like [Tiliqua scincoides]|uniref:olfactory receptor 10AG1-like n=1 Tax=Tiliqua scincoides TaxID=71010 RepID=UPI0034629139